MNKNLSKLSLFLIILGSLLLFIPNTVIATASPIQMEHKANVATNKVWEIKFNRPIMVDNLSASVRIFNPIGISVAPKKISYYKDIITIEPPALGYLAGQTYSMQIYEIIKDLNGTSLKTAVTMSFTIAVPAKGQLQDVGNAKYIYQQYDNTLSQISEIQSKVSPINSVANYSLNASSKDIYEYLNPKNFEYHEYAPYQFLKLNYIDGISEADLDNVLKGKGILDGQGKTFLDACELNDVNPAYIVAHALLETGNGNSALATGYEVDEVDGKPVELKKTYNMFGIGAYDKGANKFGSERAYKLGWFTPEEAIEGGIEFVSNDYINKSTGKQNTLYKMRWNPEHPATHQYATDIAWAYKQSSRIKDLMDKYTNVQLEFEIPQYK
ncbi:N-acetylglucosaminidase [Clostridium sp.]|uniref:N-acetylglucosaminidase n=1 Tax=Clostridium sp. TaxID=1506 RepID=UPI0025C181EE|nr:glucosaminidase domain-containing protein [Clostridium sp.]